MQQTCVCVFGLSKVKERRRAGIRGKEVRECAVLHESRDFFFLPAETHGLVRVGSGLACTTAAASSPQKAKTYSYGA